MSNRYIISFDISLNGTGYCVLDTIYKNPSIVEVGNLKMKANYTLQQKLGIISGRTKELMSRYQPLHEDVYLERSFSRFNKSTQAIYRARGVIEAELLNYNLIEFTPSNVKKIITGDGKASKEEVMKSMCEIFDTDENFFETDDESDALAVAYVGYLERQKKLDKGKKGTKK